MILVCNHCAEGTQSDAVSRRTGTSVPFFAISKGYSADRVEHLEKIEFIMVTRARGDSAHVKHLEIYPLKATVIIRILIIRLHRFVNNL